MFATELLADPLVLRAAWRRIRRWYAGAEWVPQPQLAMFELELDANLERLGRALSSGAYHPQPFRLVPYPKSGGALRHYAAPAVDDQVAFAVLLVLLGPLIDVATPRFAFGNRWHRALVRDRTRARPQWRARPYALDASAFYLPYRRDFALFRRSAHWTASAMLGREPDADVAAGSAVTRDDFTQDELPESCNQNWWRGSDAQGAKAGYWARLDLQLAYPSMRIDRLGDQLETLLTDLHPITVELALAGYPPHIARTLASAGDRVALGQRLARALAEVRYETSSVGDLWVPAHASQRLPLAGKTDDPGIPTGLAISGALLNAYLHSFDGRVQAGMNARPPGDRAALLRFADDMIVIAQSRGALAEALDSIWCALEDDDDAVLGRPRTDAAAMNLRINLNKLEPPPFTDKVRAYLSACGWSRCKDCERAVEPLPAATAPIPGFAEWLRTQPDADWLVGHQLRPDRIGPFVTHLVERMSATGTETLDERFGEGAAARMVDLHQLLRLRIEDTHVRADTRLAFAANRIARSFLPNEGSPLDGAHVDEIRRSVAEAINLVPWKFALWRSAVHAACRRPLTASIGESEDDVASKWLEGRIQHLAASTKGETWLARWPEDLKPCHPSPELRPLYVSFLRAAFWRAVAEAVRDLRDVPGGADPEGAGRPWSVHAWTFRAVDEKRAPAVAQWLSKLDQWAAQLYPEGPPTHWWELDALALAVLAVTDSEPFAQRLEDRRQGALDADVVVVAGESASSVLDMLTRAKRVISPGDVKTMSPIAQWAHFALARRPGKAKLRDAAKALYETVGAQPALRAAHSLALLNYLPRDASKLAPRLFKDLPRTALTLAQLTQYEAARRLYLAIHKRKLSNATTLHGLLWSTDLSGVRQLHPAGAPAVGLPLRVTLQMFREALEQELVRPSREGGTPIWVLQDPDVLLAARYAQLAGRMPITRVPPGPIVRLGTLSEWETLPHATYFLPAAVSGAPGSSLALHVWAHILQFFTAAQGAERFLDHLLAAWPSPVPFDERWTQRSEIPLPSEMWASIERLLRAALVQDEAAVRAACDDVIGLASRLAGAGPAADFVWERVDVSLTLGDRALEMPMGCVPMGERPPPLDARLTGDPNLLAQRVRVRVAQISEKPDWLKYRSRFQTFATPRIPRAERQRIMDQIRVAFTAPDGAQDATAKVALGPVVFPEMTLPLEETTTFRRQVLERRRAALIGRHWSLVPPACAATIHSSAPPVRYLANEALLVVPTVHPSDPSVVVVRDFVIRKPLPTHVEHGLTESLSKDRKLRSQWRMLPGTRWYRFLHPQWGDFTVAICSDLLDPAPWRSMQGQILHLLLVSYNKDVDLYDSLTWVRAYECHANVVGTNHGEYGGSIVWTPSEGGSKEVARLRGNGLFLVSDVELEVARLEADQRTGSRDAVARGRKEWESPPPRKARGFKAPPPGFPERQ